MQHGGELADALIEQLRARSEGEFELPEGTVYPALHRLEKVGYLHSEWGTHKGRKRRYYGLTDRGRVAARPSRNGSMRSAARSSPCSSW